jgi:large subunit ribosomal protein L9
MKQNEDAAAPGRHPEGSFTGKETTGMKVILNQDVIGLGEEGDIKDVANGYARNFLLPKKLAVLHTRENLAALEHKRAAIESRKEEKRKEAQGLRERLEAEEIKFAVPAGENGKLFGSVNNTLVAVELEKKGFQIEKKRIEIPEHTIRSVGAYKVKVRLYDKEEAVIKVIVEGTAQPGAAAAAQPRPRQRRAKAAAEPVPEAAPARSGASSATPGETPQDTDSN